MIPWLASHISPLKPKVLSLHHRCCHDSSWRVFHMEMISPALAPKSQAQRSLHLMKLLLVSARRPTLFLTSVDAGGLLQTCHCEQKGGVYSTLVFLYGSDCRTLVLKSCRWHVCTEPWVSVCLTTSKTPVSINAGQTNQPLDLSFSKMAWNWCGHVYLMEPCRCGRHLLLDPEPGRWKCPCYVSKKSGKIRF